MSNCSEGNPNQAVFVQAVIFNPATKSFSTYSPLVVDAGTTSAIAPTPPVLPANAVVALFGGGDDDVTMLDDVHDQCVNGADGAVFGQVFFCGAQQFFRAVNQAGVTIPSLGLATDGQPCPSVRSFQVVDQDQSDNVQTTYLITSDGRMAQNTAANRALLGSYIVMKNGSDNRLLTNFIDPALGCRPWLAPDGADNNTLQPVQALDELQAAAYQQSPVALIPSGDPMVGPNNLAILNAYRVNVDQPAIHSLGQANTVPYCAHLKNTVPAFLAAHQTAFQASGSPTAWVNLYDFLHDRYQASLTNLGCK